MSYINSILGRITTIISAKCIPISILSVINAWRDDKIAIEKSEITINILYSRTQFTMS